MIRKDVVGKEIEVGDYFIYTTSGRSSTLKFGKVSSLDSELRAITVHNSYRDWERQKGGNEMVLAASRIIVVPSTALPSRIVDLLDKKI